MNGARVFSGLLTLVLLTASAASAAAPAPRVSLQSVQANFLQEKHLQILSELAQRFSDRAFRDALTGAADADAAHALFAN